jgi:hypothetical protein
LSSRGHRYPNFVCPSRVSTGQRFPNWPADGPGLLTDWWMWQRTPGRVGRRPSELSAVCQAPVPEAIYFPAPSPCWPSPGYRRMPVYSGGLFVGQALELSSFRRRSSPAVRSLCRSCLRLQHHLRLFVCSLIRPWPAAWLSYTDGVSRRLALPSFRVITCSTMLPTFFIKVGHPHSLPRRPVCFLPLLFVFASRPVFCFNLCY